MSLVGYFQDFSSRKRIFFLLVLVIVGVTLFSVLGLVVVLLVGPNDVVGFLGSISKNSDPNSIAILKVYQLISSIGTFIFPAIMAAILFSTKWKNYLRVERFFGFKLGFFALITMLLSLPVINFLALWNSQIELTGIFEGIGNWMSQMENQNQELLEAFLIMDSPQAYLFNVLVIAIAPAVGEELIFRGVLQKELQSAFKNHHVAIWISAAIFSAIHFQFYGFIPRMLLGALFGYVFVWTKNLWYPILMHFVNNFAALTIAYATDQSAVAKQIENYGSTNEELSAVAIAFVLAISLIWLLKKESKKNLPEGDF